MRNIITQAMLPRRITKTGTRFRWLWSPWRRGGGNQGNETETGEGRGEAIGLW